MKKVILLSCFLLVAAAGPAHAQLFRRPIFHSPAFQQLLHIPISIPTPIGNVVINPATSSSQAMTVDSVVQTNITATKQNLDSASTIINDLLKRNGIASGPTPAAPGTTPVVGGVPVPPKTGPIR